MHRECYQFLKEVKKCHPRRFRFKRVLEVGSRYINGTARKLFWFCDYTGLDLDKGRCVDVVCHGADWEADNHYEVVISCEALEHDSRWEESLEVMYRNLKPGGLLIVTCASINRAEHGTTRTLPQDSPSTNDHYRNISTDDFFGVLPIGLFREYFLGTRRKGQDLLFFGIKATTNDSPKSPR